MVVVREGVNKRDDNKCKLCGSKIYLDQETVKKMIERFLFEKRISKRKLALAMGVTSEDIRKLIYSKKAYLNLIGKINLPLIRFYCLTKWTGSDGVVV
jgi:hypothetical protein